MAVEADPTRADAFYDDFYKSGGWKYSWWREYWWHRRNVVKRFGLRRGMHILEVACGSGFHTNLFNRMGFTCIGVDRSRTGIEWARRNYPRSVFECGDITAEMPVEPSSFDAVLARGCSHYHYDLMSEQALGTTNHLMRYLKPGGVFIMVIVTDLSGRREPDKVWQNTLEDYQRHFSSFGKRWSVEWVKGMAVCGLFNEVTDPSPSSTPAAGPPAETVVGASPALSSS